MKMNRHALVSGLYRGAYLDEIEFQEISDNNDDGPKELTSQMTEDESEEFNKLIHKIQTRLEKDLNS